MKKITYHLLYLPPRNHTAKLRKRFYSILNYYCMLSVFHRLHLIIKRKYLKLHALSISIEKFSCKFAIGFLVLRYQISQIFDLSSIITNLFSDFQFLITPYNDFQDPEQCLIPHLLSSISSRQNLFTIINIHVEYTNERSSNNALIARLNPRRSFHRSVTHRNKRTRDTHVSLACLQPERCN